MRSFRPKNPKPSFPARHRLVKFLVDAGVRFSDYAGLEDKPLFQMAVRHGFFRAKAKLHYGKYKPRATLLASRQPTRR